MGFCQFGVFYQFSFHNKNDGFGNVGFISFNPFHLRKDQHQVGSHHDDFTLFCHLFDDHCRKCLQQFEVNIPEIICVTWNIYDSYGDGICCEYGEGYVRLLDAQSGDEIFYVNGDYGFGTSRLFATLDPYIGIQENVSCNIRIYPNPASELVNIFSDVEIISLSIFNNVGQTMETRAIDGKYYSLDIKKLHVGVYTLKITTARGMAVKQIIVE